MTNIQISNPLQLSQTFRSFNNKNASDKISIKEILNSFGSSNDLYVALFLFALPVTIPLPYPPGSTSIVGIPLIILSWQLLLGSEHVILPSRILNYQIHNSTMSKISNKIVPVLQLIERYLKPRLLFTETYYSKKFIASICLICSILITIPFPMTTSLPALGITIMILGLINKDGLIIILGILTSIISIIIAVLVLTVGWIGIKYFFNLIF